MYVCMYVCVSCMYIYTYVYIVCVYINIYRCGMGENVQSYIWVDDHAFASHFLQAFCCFPGFVFRGPDPFALVDLLLRNETAIPKPGSWCGIYS